MKSRDAGLPGLSKKATFSPEHSRTVGAGPEIIPRFWPEIGHQQKLNDHVVLGGCDIIRKAQASLC